MVLRPEKQARAALNNFETWHSQKLAQCPDYFFPIANSTVGLARCVAPHGMMYFLIQVLQRLLHQFWATAQKDWYVQECRIANGRCPPSIIGLLFYYDCRYLSPAMSVAIPVTNKQRLHDSETARAAARVAQSAGSATAASSGDAAPVRDRGDAFWQTFAENVMQHLVWPAVWAGVIRVAPKSDRDNPPWWTREVLPILNDPEVGSLHWVGGNRMARKSWYHVCEVLATYEFPAVVRPEPFTQKTVPEFLKAAGYCKVLASEDVAATDPLSAKRSRASSCVSRGAGGRTAGTPAVPDVPFASKSERARVQADFAQRLAYSELDQRARGTIASAEWRLLAHPRVCRTICEAFRMYQTTRGFSREPLDPKAVVAELRCSVEYFSVMKLWPSWVLQSNARVVRSLPEVDAAYEDFGNENWEALVNLMNLSSVIPSVYGKEILNAPANAENGLRVNKSGVASYKFRGNVVERFLTYLCHESEQEDLAVKSPASPF